jgi:hypothetical protein
MPIPTQNDVATALAQFVKDLARIVDRIRQSPAGVEAESAYDLDDLLDDARETASLRLGRSEAADPRDARRCFEFTDRASFIAAECDPAIAVDIHNILSRLRNWVISHPCKNTSDGTVFR